ncbi:hypothetical protein LTR62_007194 [Meristemomyces frigidus]|uniref:Early meiotic induction protein 1 n=1 Tax=Meristemomyces frigidus TaxID=1508187 RepID=A0AAN7TAU7_9PEZI|nr:hypothetical protein LTR62_007194 [Meristemomyces frigidus]
MGWWPLSSAPSPNIPGDEATPKRDFSLTDEQRVRIFGQPSTKNDDGGADSREQRADAELEAFLKSFESPDLNTPTPTPSIDTATGKAADPAPTPYDRILPDGTLNIHPTALYPATINCRQAFDQAFYCQSLGGKFNDIYRFGKVKDCSEQWGAFWFCMRTRTLPAPDKERAVREYYRLRDEKRREENAGNSEDVWELRTEAVQRAFWRDPESAEENHMGVKE